MKQVKHTTQTLLDAHEKILDFLYRYDEGLLATPTGIDDFIEFSYQEAQEVIEALRQGLITKGQASELFGFQKNQILEGILKGINQSFAGQPLYPSHAQRAAHLLYFIIKDHPFGDGNKRIGCILFSIYLQKSKLIFANNDQDALATLALFIADSAPSAKETVIQVITSFLLH